MVDWTSSAGRKLARGIEHVNTLRRETGAFENAEAYVLETEREIRSDEEVSYRCVAVQRVAPPDHWPLLAGEAIHNLRSALESAVYAASDGANGTGFPIFTNPREFKKNGRPLIARTPKPVRALIEARQPYNARESSPAWDALVQLRVLSNRDKHRELSAVAAAVEFPYVGTGEGADDFAFTYMGVDQELGEKTEVMAFTVRGPNAAEVHVDPHFRYEIRIEGRPLGDTLVWISRRVFECVYEIQTAEPMPWMTGPGFYPI